MAIYKKNTAVLSAQGCGWQNLTWFLCEQSSNDGATYNNKQNIEKTPPCRQRGERLFYQTSAAKDSEFTAWSSLSVIH